MDQARPTVLSCLLLLCTGVGLPSCRSSAPKRPEAVAKQSSCLPLDQLQAAATLECKRLGWMGGDDTLDHAKGMALWPNRVLATSGGVVTPKNVFDIITGGHYEVFAIQPGPRKPGEIQEWRVLVIVDARDPGRMGTVTLPWR